jgi:hypothetical protein
MKDLILCRSCTRHVRRTEERCPFCGTGIAAEARNARPPVAPSGLSRAKLYAFHAAVATGVATAACGGSTVTTTDGGGSLDGQSNDAIVAADGQGGSDAAEAAAQEAGGDDGAGQPEGGQDSSTVAETGTDGDAADAGADTWGPPPPPYGCVFPEGCGDVKV